MVAYMQGRTRTSSRGSRVFESFAVNLTMTLMGGLWFMLGVGIVHHEWIPQCPTIGFGWSVLLAAMVRSALFLATPNGDRR